MFSVPSLKKSCNFAERTPAHQAQFVLYMNQRNRQILQLALPSIVSNITVPLLGLVDVAIVGHMGNAAFIGAIAVGSMISNMIYWIFGFLRMGTSGMTAQARGRRDMTEVVRLLLRSLSVGFLVALAIIVLQEPLKHIAFFLIRPTAEVESLATTYYYIVVWGAPAMLSLYGLSGWFIGMQNTRIPMFISIFQNVVNIVASLLLVFVCGMKLEGVALGTVIAQYGGLLVALLLLWKHYRRLRKYTETKGLLNGKAMWRFFQVNRDIFLRTLFLVGVNLFFVSAGAAQGETILAVNTLLIQLYILFSYVMDGFAFAGEALGGRYWGAGNRAAFTDTVRKLFAWGVVMVVLFTALYAFGGSAFLRLLTNETEVIAASTAYFPWAVAIPAAGVAAFVWDGIFIGTTQTRGMLLSSAISALLFFATYLLLKPTMANHALWLAFLVFLLMRGVVQTVIQPHLNVPPDESEE